MEKLYSRKSRFDAVLAGRYSLPVMFAMVGIMVMLPWEDWGRIPWYASVMEYQETIFSNLQKLDKELAPERAEFFKPMVAFLNIIGWPLYVYVLTKVPISDKIVSGEKSIGGAILVLMAVFIIVVFSPWILLEGGTHGGMLTKITRATDYGLTMVFILVRWGVVLSWFVFISVLLGIIKRLCFRNSKNNTE